MEKRSSSRMLGSSKLVTLVAAILSLCLMAMLVGQGVQKAQAASLNLNLKSSVSVQFSKDAADKGATPANTNLRYMMYKVADVEQPAGYDAYSFAYPATATHKLLDIEDINELNSATASKPLSASAYDEMAQRVAASIVKNADLGTPVAVTYNVPATPAQEIAAGLYVIVPFGADTVTTPDSPTVNVLTTTKTTDTKETIYVSNAYTDTQKLVFKPQLVALPTKDIAGITDEAGNLIGGTSNSANPEAWNYEPTLTLKPTVESRKGSLTINKELITGEYNNEGIGNNTATFVFSIKGYADEARTKLVFDDVASVVIDTKNSTKNSTLVKNIPAGLYIVVTEIYTGTSYEAVTKGEQTTVIVATDSTLIDGTASDVEGASVKFENTYNNTGNKGGSITNRFEYSNSDQNSRTSGGWDWSPLHDYEAAQAQGGDN